MSLKEVENPEQDWLAQFCTDPDRKEREQRIKALLKRVRDAIEALSREECDDFIEYLDLSVQEVDEMCRLLDDEIRSVRSWNELIIEELKALTPKRVWGVRAPQPPREERYLG